MTEGGPVGPPFSPEEIARQDAEWGAFQDELAQDPGMAAYLEHRRHAHPITSRRNPMDHADATALIESLTNLTNVVYEGIETLNGTLVDIASHLEDIDATLDGLGEEVAKITNELYTTRTSDQ